MKRFAAAAAAAFTMSALAATAHAGTQNYTFSGATDFGQFTGNATLDVENGYAVSGTGTISGDHLGQQTLTLLTAATPGAEVAGDGSFGYRSNQGDDFGGFDDAAPSDFLFALGPDAPAPGANLIFGIYDAGGGQYDSGLFGSSSDGTRFYEYDTPATLQAATVSAAPEPASWALMLGGVGILGGMLRILSARRREDQAMGLATA